MILYLVLHHDIDVVKEKIEHLGITYDHTVLSAPPPSMRLNDICLKIRAAKLN